VVIFVGGGSLKFFEQLCCFGGRVSAIESGRVGVDPLRPELSRFGQPVADKFLFADLLFWLFYWFFWRHNFSAFGRTRGLRIFSDPVVRRFILRQPRKRFSV
jgi:hypothetical protein